jgi:hypothetical protein
VTNSSTASNFSQKALHRSNIEKNLEFQNCIVVVFLDTWSPENFNSKVRNSIIVFPTEGQARPPHLQNLEPLYGNYEVEKRLF